jgi:peptidoglycan/LPS O-acetylase OafA/YrhL
LPGERYIVALNGLRGVAIAMVLMVHLAVGDAMRHRGPFWHQLNQFMWLGWSGVDLFFVLSGFLITGILIDTRHALNFFRSFYGRRALRIFPLYYLMVAFAVLFSVLALPHLHRFQMLGSQHTSVAGWVSYVLYYQNWWIPLKEPAGGFPIGHFWSLGVEEEFYLCWPLCVYLLRDRTLARVCVVVSVVVLALRCYLVHKLGGTAPIILMSTATRADALLLGALVAITVRSAAMLRAAKNIAPWLGGIALLGVVLLTARAHEIFVRSTWTQSIGLTGYALLYAVVVLYVFLQDGTGSLLDRVMRWRWLQFLGKYSYGLYVYHAMIFFALTLAFRQKSWYTHKFLPAFALQCVEVGLSIAVAYLSFQFWEKPFLRLKGRFEARVEPHLPRTS